MANTMQGLRPSELTTENLLRLMVDRGASDLHLSAGSVPAMRIDGRIKKVHELDAPTPEVVEQLVYQLLDEQQRKAFEAEHDLDFACALPGVARFRCNIHRQRSTIGMIVRSVPHEIPTGEQLGLPVVCRDLVLKPRGLVLVTGPTGSGKSTTLAAMLDFINTHQDRHILTLEDPVEFVHSDKKSIITQREIGLDCRSFAQALRRALRQDPDIIMVGELRDLETMSLAITAAETGHLVLGTAHTTSAAFTIDRLIDAFPAEAQQQARIQLANTLQGVVSQSLVKRRDGGRVAAFEILVTNDAVRSMIRDGKTQQIYNAIQTGRSGGMITLEESLARLAKHGLISVQEALSVANRPHEVAKHAEVMQIVEPEPDELDEPLDG